ncbi:hypothetical protein MLD38_037439 [Melastoma candidum]|uniref:Uncharacterized protein n=1 Tax=Melastoma candidum TaxID=119954 RepID=A0ACB9LNB5_9MYRT|nr:hypothetical protein MLD38_037439 [Melastoma candidum]
MGGEGEPAPRIWVSVEGEVRRLEAAGSPQDGRGEGSLVRLRGRGELARGGLLPGAELRLIPPGLGLELIRRGQGTEEEATTAIGAFAVGRRDPWWRGSGSGEEAND